MIVPVSRSMLPQATLLVERALHDTPYLDGALDSLRGAVSAPGPDGRALASIVSDDADEDYLAAVIIYGFFGGTDGAGRLLLTVTDVASRRSHLARALAEEAFALLHGDGARFVLAELPDDPQALPGGSAFLESLGFVEESRVEHFYRDGIALSFMRRELGAL